MHGGHINRRLRPGDAGIAISGDFAYGCNRNQTTIPCSGLAPLYSLPRQHFLYFLPLPQGHGSLRPTLGPAHT
jgi:hypothetical protein